MRKHEREIHDPAEIEEVLRAARVLRLAMSVGDRPYVVPLNFGYEPGRLYFHCATEGRKLDIISENPNVSFEAEADVELVPGERSCGWTVKYRSVIGFGTARVVADEAEKRRGLDVLMRHHGAPGGDYAPQAFEKTTVVAVDIEAMTGKKLHR